MNSTIYGLAGELGATAEDKARILELAPHFAQLTIHWNTIEPVKGQYDFSELDQKLAAYTIYEPIVTIQHIPPLWMPLLPVPDWCAAWGTMFGAVVSHLVSKDRPGVVVCLGNEPWYTNDREGRPAGITSETGYVPYCNWLYQWAKTSKTIAVGRVRIGGPVWSQIDWGWEGSVLTDLGYDKQIDVLVLHSYGLDQPATFDKNARLAEILVQWRRLCPSHPFYVTEVGVPGGDLGMPLRADALVRVLRGFGCGSYVLGIVRTKCIV